MRKPLAIFFSILIIIIVIVIVACLCKQKSETWPSIPRSVTELDAQPGLIIWRTYKDDSWQTKFRQAISITQDTLPSVRQVVFTDAMISPWIRTHFGSRSREIIGYETLSRDYGAARADLWRLLVIYIHGGLYLDIKSAVIGQLPDLDKLYLGQGRGDWMTASGVGELQNWFIYAPRRHRLIRFFIDSVLHNISSLKRGELDFATQRSIAMEDRLSEGKTIVLNITGPRALTLAFERSSVQDRKGVEIVASPSWRSGLGGALQYSFIDGMEHESIWGRTHYSGLLKCGIHLIAPERRARSSAIVSMTTLPSRIRSAHFQTVIYSIIDQNPDEVLINIPDTDARTNTPYTVPTWLVNEQIVRIHYCGDDMGPRTKLFGGLQGEAVPLEIWDRETRIICLDDDIVYKHGVLDALRHGEGVLACRYQPEESPGLIGDWEGPILQGYAGYSMPNSLVHRLADMDNPPACLWVDDMWLTVTLSLLGIQIHQIEQYAHHWSAMLDYVATRKHVNTDELCKGDRLRFRNLCLAALKHG